MDYSNFLYRKCFVKSSHGLHYGIVMQDEYDYVILGKAKLFIPESFEELCPELCAITRIDMDPVVAPVPLLQINNVKEIARVDDALTGYYDSLTLSDTLT